MRINTDGCHEYRLDLLRRVMQQTGEGTKSGAFDFSTEFTSEMLRNLDQALDHLDKTPELAEILSTPSVQPEYRVEINLDIAPSQGARVDAERLELMSGGRGEIWQCHRQW